MHEVGALSVVTPFIGALLREAYSHPALERCLLCWHKSCNRIQVKLFLTSRS